MNPKRLLSPGLWLDIARETRWKTLQGSPRKLPSTWPLPENLRQVTAVRWPSRYAWPQGEKWVNTIKRGLSALVPLTTQDLPQPDGCLVHFIVDVHGRPLPCTVDYSDYPRIDEDQAFRSAVYFKMQFAKGGYGRSNVIPGGFIPAQNDVYAYLPHLRALADCKPPHYAVYGRFGLEFAEGTRRKALEILHSQRAFDFCGGATRVRYSRFLREIAESRICIDLPGNGDFCFRLIDYFAIGACVIAAPHNTELHEPLRDRIDIIFTRPDMSDLLHLCNHYLQHNEERIAVRDASRNYFDRYLQYAQLASYYLRSLYDQVAGRPRTGV
jgi:hypothetical protein